MATLLRDGRLREPVFWALVAFGVLADQVSKLVVFAALDGSAYPREGPAVIPGFFFITPRLNPGMAWSLFSSLGKAQPALFALLNAIVTAGVIWYRRALRAQNAHVLFDAGFGLVIAGAVGNLIDRLHPPFRVMDFLHFRFGSWDYPVFNVADVYIVVGVIVFMYCSWRYKVEQPNGAGRCS